MILLDENGRRGSIHPAPVKNAVDEEPRYVARHRMYTAPERIPETDLLESAMALDRHVLDVWIVGSAASTRPLRMGGSLHPRPM